MIDDKSYTITRSNQSSFGLNEYQSTPLIKENTSYQPLYNEIRPLYQYKNMLDTKI
jgi:hypothetical protein